MKILIKNGLIIDGTGSPGFKSDLLIEEDKIIKIGNNLIVEDAEVIDASNKVVSPGFIDMHSHGDLTILQINKAEPTIMQGVTTLVVGMCGLGLAPANDRVRDYYSNFVSNVLGPSEIQLYDTLQGYMKLIEQKGISTNLVFFIPHGNVRTSILGLENRHATREELEAMKNIVKRGMEAGAFGISTGLIYPPGIITPTEELIELSKVVSKYNGIYDSHIRNEYINIISIGMGELIEISKKAKIQAQISHWKAETSPAWKLTSDMIKKVKDARNEGLQIYADLYPYDESYTSLSGLLLPPWIYNNFEENLSLPETRKKIASEIINRLSTSISQESHQTFQESTIKEGIFAYLQNNFRIISVSRNHQIEGFKLGKALKIIYPNKEFIKALLDFIRDEKGSIMVSIKTMNERKSITTLFKQDFVCIGSDGFLIQEKNTHPRSYGTFPKVLAKYVRKKKIISLEEGIRKMTSLPASILHLKNRGILKENYKADIVIFDFDKIRDKSTYVNARQYPEGINYVIVNGEITVKNGKHLGLLNGKILRHGKSESEL